MYVGSQQELDDQTLCARYALACAEAETVGIAHLDPERSAVLYALDSPGHEPGKGGCVELIAYPDLSGKEAERGNG